MGVLVGVLVIVPVGVLVAVLVAVLVTVHVGVRVGVLVNVKVGVGEFGGGVPKVKVTAGKFIQGHKSVVNAAASAKSPVAVGSPFRIWIFCNAGVTPCSPISTTILSPAKAFTVVIALA